MGIQNTSDASVMTGSSASPVQNFLKNPQPHDAPSPEPSPTPVPQTKTLSPNVPFTEEDRNRIGRKLTEAIAKAVQSGNLLSEEQLQEIAEDIPILVNKVQTQEDLTLVFDALADKWPFLSAVISEERKQYAAMQNVEQMFEKQTNTNSADIS